jgi:hypothetical protein
VTQNSQVAVVWKFPFDVEGYFERDLPEGARIISVAVQAGHPCFWAVVNPQAPTRRRRFYLLGTGHEMYVGGPSDVAGSPADLVHLGSFMLEGGAFVGHLFELALHVE